MRSTDELIIDVMKKELLTPVVYKMVENDVITVIGFFDRETALSSFFEVQDKLEVELNKEVHIYDFRDFDEGDRLEILKNTELIYSENEFIKSMFEAAMVEDLRDALHRKNVTVQRDEKTGTIYYS